MRKAYYRIVETAPNLRIGTSGWHYPSGRGTWNGVFYPPARGRPKGFDELAFYAEHFSTVEVNATFYGQPRADTCRGWAARTPAGFEFSVKLYQKFTHPRMFEEALAKSVPTGGQDPSTGEFLKTLTRPNRVDLDEFRRGIEPLASSGKLGALLAQFPPSFKNEPSSRDYLTSLLRAFAGYRIAVELRHRSWSDRLAETLARLNECGAAWVQIDEPKFRFSIRQNLLPNVPGFYYMRLHGRNAAQWWRHDAAEDRYNYLYSADEIQDFARTVDAARRLVGKAYLYTNNHYSAKSVANAAMLKKQLGEPLRGRYSDAFQQRYPELADRAHPIANLESLIPDP
jgi:uncharacterized protein YecE (DUF72 family)